MLEKGLLEKSEPTYLYQRGTDLTKGLIDIDHAYNLVSRLQDAMEENLGYELTEEEIR